MPVESMVGTGAYGPIVLAFPAQSPQPRVHSWGGEELETNLLSCRGLFAPACWLLSAQPLGVIRQFQLGDLSTPWAHGLH